MSTIPYFKPLFPAITWTCQLCGEQGAKEDFITERVRGGIMRSENGEAVFCQKHSAVAGIIVSKVQEYRAERYAELEREIEAEMPALVARWIHEQIGGPAVPEP